MYKIMIVEDDLTLGSTIKEGLVRWGFTSVIVEEFSDILKEYIQNKPHLVIMDINLPYFDGFYWCQKIREVSKVPILFVSSRDSNMDIVMAVNIGGDDFVTKPFSMDILIAKITALLRRTYSYGEEKNDVIEHRGIIFSIGDGNILFNEEKIELTKNEQRILMLLMRNIGKIISRDRIMKALWDDEVFVNDNTLTVNINRLRNKIGDIGIKDFITTKKGQGYVIL